MAKLVKNGVVSISSKALPSCLNTQFMVIWILMENLSTNFSPKLNCRHLIKSRKSKPKSLFLSKLLIDLFKLRLFRWLSSHLQKISPKPYFTFFFIQGNMSPFFPLASYLIHIIISISFTYKHFERELLSWKILDLNRIFHSTQVILGRQVWPTPWAWPSKELFVQLQRSQPGNCLLGHKRTNIAGLDFLSNNGRKQRLIYLHVLRNGYI